MPSEQKEFSYRHFRGNWRGRPFCLEVKAFCPIKFSFLIKKESFLDRFFKKTCLSKEIQTGDSFFDQRFYIDTPVPEWAAQYLGKQEKREAIQKIFQIGFNKLSSDGNSITALWEPFRKEEPDTALIEETNRHLSVLKKELPQIDPLSPEMQKRNSVFGQFLLLIPILFLVTDIYYLPIFATSFYSALDYLIFESLKYSLPALAIYFFLLTRNIASRSSSHKTLLTYGLMALIAFPLTGWGTYQILNGLLDKGAAIEHQAKIVRTIIGKVKGKGRNRIRYYVILSSWREGHTEEEIKIEPSDYSFLTLSGKQELLITTKPGFFGKEWVVGYQLAR